MSGIAELQSIVNHVQSLRAHDPQWVELTSVAAPGMAVVAPILNRRLLPTGRTKIMMHPKDFRQMAKDHRAHCEARLPDMLPLSEYEQMCEARAAAGRRGAKGSQLFGLRVYDVDEQTPERAEWMAEIDRLGTPEALR